MDSLIYVITGKDESLVNTQSRLLVNQLLHPEQRATGLSAYDGDDVLICEVLDELRTVPFLTDKRVVLVKGADDFVSKNRPLLEKYFDNPCPTGRLILVVSTWPAGTKLAKKLSQAGSLINVTEPKRAELPGRLIKYAADAHGKKLDRDAAELLIELTGEELPRLYSEIDKLAVFADAQRAITAKDIESLVGHNRIFGAFEVIDAVIAGNTAVAVERLRNMFAEDKSAEYTVVGAFAFHLRRLFTAKTLLEKGLGPAEVAKQVRIWSNKDAFFGQLRQISLTQIGATLRQLAEIDHAMKTGQTKAAVAIEQLVLKLAGCAGTTT